MSELSLEAGDAWGLVTARNNLPTATTRIVGRGHIIELLRRDVEQVRLVSIVGAGGMGKTTVALAVAEQAAGSFRDGAWLIDFAPLREPSLVPNVIAAAMGLVVHSAHIMAALSRFMRDRETLLVLDNCEHLLDAIALCTAQILAEAPGVHILVTSRTPLRATGEQVHRLPGLAVPPVSTGLTAEMAMVYPAVELFVERATDRLETFTLSDAEAPTVADICRNLDGIALAIELAAMRVDVFGVGGLYRQLDDRFRLLAGRRAGLERHRTLAATLDWSYGLLPAEEAALLRAVSVFAGTFRRNDAAAVGNISSLEAGVMLTELAAKSLLSVEADAGEVAYRPLETTRAYCQEKLLASGEEHMVRHRHADYIGAIIGAAAGEWGQRPSAEWGAAYGRYLDDLRAALAWAGADPASRPLLITLTSAGTALWNHFSLTDESRTHLRRAISALHDTNSAGTAVEMNLQLALAGAVLYTRGIVPEAWQAMRRALDISELLGDDEARLQCLRLIGTYQLFGGETDTGIGTLEAFVALAASVDPSAVPEGETHLGVGEMFAGRLQGVRQRLERLYADGLQDLNDPNSLRFLYNNSINVMIVLSHVQWLTGSPAAAERTGAMLVEYALNARHELSLSIGLAWASLLFWWAGREEECGQYAAMLDDLVERHGIVIWRPFATFCRGALASLHKDTLSEGIRDLERTVAECREMGHMARVPYFIGVLADALARNGRLEEAEDRMGDALDLAIRQNEQWCRPELLRIQATILAARGHVEEQEAILMSSMRLAEEIGAWSWRLRAANDLARLWQAQGRTLEARLMLQPVYDAFTEGVQTRDLATAAGLLDQLG